MLGGIALTPSEMPDTWKRIGYWETYAAEHDDASLFLRIEGARMTTLTLV